MNGLMEKESVGGEGGPLPPVLKGGSEEDERKERAMSGCMRREDL